MIVPILVAVLAAVSTAQCQEVTQIATRCTTSYTATMVPGPISTGYFTTTSTFNFSITSTTQETITVTPSATVFTDIVSVTSTETTTVVSTPPAITIAAPAGFFPLLNTGIAPTATATGIGRHRRASIESRAQHIERVKRLPKTPAGNTSGFLMFPNGQGQSLANTYPSFVECQVSVNITSTTLTIVTALPQTEVLVPATATAVSTTTFYATETILEVAAQPTKYAACQANNVVNNIVGFANAPIYFDRIIFENPEGFPTANILVVNTTSAVNCCIACQKTPYCAGSFYAPSITACHLQLNQAVANSTGPTLPSGTLPPFPLPSSNTSLPYPNASGAPYAAGNGSVAYYPTGTAALVTGYTTLIPVATPISSSEAGMSILPVTETPATGTFAQPGAGTCSAGSMSLYLGRVYGQSNFPPEVALYVSNGPCGRMSVGFDEAPPVTQEDLPALVQRRWIGSALL